MNMRMLARMAAATAFLLVPIFGPAPARAATNSNALEAKVVDVHETRGSQSRCSVMLSFTGDMLADKMAVLKARATKAVDDTGRNLVLPGDGDVGGAGTSGGFSLAAVRGWHELRPTKTRWVGVQLAGTARGAKTIAELSGELELFAPTFENGGVVVVEGFLQQPGQALQHPELEELGVTLTYLTRETYDAAKKTAAVRSAPGRPSANPQDSQEESLFPGILVEPFRGPGYYLVLRVVDPGRKVTSFAFREPGGRLLPVGNGRSVNDLRGFYFHTAIPKDLALVVYLAVPKALETVPFEVRNITLP